MSETILEEAAQLTGNGGDRHDGYDHPSRNFDRIARMWGVIFDKEITPRQVALAMIAMKVVRDNHQARRDNIVDIAGYARCIERLDERVAPVELQLPWLHNPGALCGSLGGSFGV